MRGKYIINCSVLQIWNFHLACTNKNRYQFERNHTDLSEAKDLPVFVLSIMDTHFIYWTSGSERKASSRSAGLI